MVTHVQKAYELKLLTEGYKYIGVEPWVALTNKIRRIERRMSMRTFATTTQLSHDKSFGKVKSPKSKVESYCLDEIHDKEELELLRAIKSGVIKAFEQAKLSTLERELILKLLDNPYIQLSAYARKKGLCGSYVYKVRDRAAKKIQTEVEKVLSEL